MKKVELLSPAGGYETMVGAFNAGADAVYLGGSRFGARAYADNFDRDEVLDAISYAHLHGKRIYMTVNTLIKEKEFDEVYDFMLPYAEKKLDGVIVQDLGVARLIRREFPDIELHASTQMTVTGVYGARLLKERGFTRVVPARELSLNEMRAIREKADIEVEAFIHGAMCYCYSGMCLFSSMVGGRSGNRGRCAQPCRLPYHTVDTGDKEEYLLSLKDMSTIGMIPELIDAGIDSFKIEGRMKRAEYSAGVTALYRKYIDAYYEDPSAPFSVSKEDMETLKNLYQRTGISEGYYHRHNGRDMVTISSPAYNATSDEVLNKVHEEFLTDKLRHSCDISCNLTLGKEAEATMRVIVDGGELIAGASGNLVQEAQKRPMDEESIKKQLKKLGESVYKAENIDITIDDGGSGKGIFISVGELNNLRRELTDKMDSLITDYYLAERRKEGVSGYVIVDNGQGGSQCNAPYSLNAKSKDSTIVTENTITKITKNDSNKLTDNLLNNPINYHVLASTKEQLDVILDTLNDTDVIKRVYVDSNVFLSDDFNIAPYRGRADFYVALPYITREEAWDGTSEIESVLDKIEERGFSGVLVRNLEELSYIRSRKVTCDIILDYGIYCWNHEAGLELIDFNSCGDDQDRFMTRGFTTPYELSFSEAREMAVSLKKYRDITINIVAYGYVLIFF